ncbi:hypothetical protein CVT24_009905 [Panaeolus cyanescens]|uniref:JmjC domain-containing protein n=1 Tax=Panaeolus cyanescens TaxID=181874 RepID=A0A409WFI0_9AGAR|nr:hypothetical protein CVT24_009905 [Panaeolus cyanescens]
MGLTPIGAELKDVAQLRSYQPHSKPSNGLQVRTLSPLIRSLPWDTDVLTTTDDFRMLGIPALESLSASLYAHEKRVFSFADCGPDTIDTHHLLGIEITASPNGTVDVCLRKDTFKDPQNYTLAQANRMTTLLTCYRLLDVICSRDPSFNNRRGCVVEGGPPTDSKAASLPFISSSHSWSSFLSIFHSSSSSKITVSAEPHETSDIHGTGFQRTSSLLIKQLVVNRKQRHVNTVESNFLLCALAMVCMLKFTSDQGGVPMLPDSAEAFADILGHHTTINGQTVRSEDTKEFIKICESCRPATSQNSNNLWHIMLPLVCVLWFTPLALLSTRSLTTLVFRRRLMLTIPLAFGNNKSPLQQQCENAILDTLLDIVYGKVDPCHTFKVLHSRMPWAEILDINNHTTIDSWFSIGPVCTERDKTSTASQRIESDNQTQDSIIETPSTGATASPSRPQSLLSPSSLSQPQEHPSSHLQTPMASLSANSSNSLDALPPSHSNSVQSLIPPILSHQSQLGLPAVTSSNLAASTEPQPPISVSSNIVSKTSLGPPTIDSEVITGPRRSAVNALERILAATGAKKTSSRSDTNVSNPNKRKVGSSELGVVSTNGHAIEVIDVDAFVALRDPVGIAPVRLTRRREEPLNVDTPVQQIVSAESLVAYDIAGNSHEFNPPAHYDDYISRLKTLASRAKNSYIDGRPKHVSGTSSVFHRMSFRDFSTASPIQLQDILRSKCIVLTDWGHERSGFDSKNLQDIVPLFRPISIQDYSVRPPPDGSKTQPSSGPLPSTPVVLTGTMQQMLENASLGSMRKVLNALDLPISGTLATPSVLSSDFFAWEAMKGIHQHLDFLSYPTSDMSWYLAGLEGAVTFFHIDSDGLATGINVEYGKKLWAIMTPHSSIGPCNVKELTDDDFSLDEVGDLQNVDIEMVVLRATDGIMLAFNFAEHVEKRFGSCEFDKFHLIDITDWKGLAALLTLCNLVILSNVLDFRTYLGPNQPDDSSPTPKHIIDMESFDSNHITWAERMAICDARGRAWTILLGVTACCDITSIQEASSPQFSAHDLSNIPLLHLARQLVAIGSLKRSAVRSKLDGAPHCTVELLTRQLDNVARWKSELHKLYAHQELITLDCTQTSFTGEEGYTIRWKNNLHDWYTDKKKECSEDTSFMDEGITDFDRKFLTRDLNGPRPAKRAKSNV